MSTMQSKCRYYPVAASAHELREDTRFIDCENWRKDFGVDELVRTFDYIEKPKVFEYYPQYYHKTDKVTSVRRR